MTRAEVATPVSAVASALTAMDAFFALPLPTRMATVLPSPAINRGYAPSRSEVFGSSAGLDTPPDLLEAFIVGPEHPDLDDPAVLAQRDGVFAPNRWPAVDVEVLDAIRDPIVAYVYAVSVLARRLTELFAVALDPARGPARAARRTRAAARPVATLRR